MYLTWWAGALCLSLVATAYWLVNGNLLGVSGSLASLLRDKKLFGHDSDTAQSPVMSQGSVASQGSQGEPADMYGAHNTRASALSVWNHLIFLVSIAAGAFAVNYFRPHVPTLGMLDQNFQTMMTALPIPGWAVLLTGGTLVGFGTSMLGGCTSGHGLCGCSRMQLPSLVATSVFFATGTMTAFLLKGLWE